MQKSTWITPHDTQTHFNLFMGPKPRIGFFPRTQTYITMQLGSSFPLCWAVGGALWTPAGPWQTDTESHITTWRKKGGCKQTRLRQHVYTLFYLFFTLLCSKAKCFKMLEVVICSLQAAWCTVHMPLFWLKSGNVWGWLTASWENLGDVTSG